MQTKSGDSHHVLSLCCIFFLRTLYVRVLRKITHDCKMWIFCLEGAAGAGKSTLVQLLKPNFPVLEEEFMDPDENRGNRVQLHPQGLVMEARWVSRWFERALLLAKQGTKCAFSDRSPYSAEIYGHCGELLAPMIREQIQELASHDIHVVTILVHVDQDILWDRVQQRLLREPHRVKYGEADKEFFRRIMTVYERHAWDFRVDNTPVGVHDALGLIRHEVAHCMAIPRLMECPVG